MAIPQKDYPCHRYRGFPSQEDPRQACRASDGSKHIMIASEHPGFVTKSRAVFVCIVSPLISAVVGGDPLLDDREDLLVEDLPNRGAQRHQRDGWTVLLLNGEEALRRSLDTRCLTLWMRFMMDTVRPLYGVEETTNCQCWRNICSLSSGVFITSHRSYY